MQVKSPIERKKTKFTKSIKKKAGGSSGVASTVQLRAQRQGGRIRKTQKASSWRVGTEINHVLRITPHYMLKSCNSGQITLSQLRAMGTFFKRNIKKRSGIVIRRVFPYVPMTKKPSEVRMGKGKGNKINKEIYPVRPGKVIYELFKVRARLAIFCLQVAARKLSIKTRIVRTFEL